MKIAFLAAALLTMALAVQAHLLRGGGGVGGGGGGIAAGNFTGDFTGDFN